MNTVLLIASLLLAALGLYLLFDFIVRRVKGDVIAGELIGYLQEEKAKPVPMVKFNHAGKTINGKIRRIEQFTFWIVRPAKGAPVAVLYNAERNEASLYGYLNPLFGVLLFLPLFFAGAAELGRSTAFAQIFFLAVFILLIAGLAALLRLVQKYY